MSIPPLVCSTPPPPDQCEDDKDNEDFDLQYNLSQDDDDENYDYGSFTTYNKFQTVSEIKKPDFESTVKVTAIEEISKRLVENKQDHFQTVPESKNPDSESQVEVIANEEVSKRSEDDTNGIESDLTNIISELESKTEEDVNIEDLNLEIDQVILGKSEEIGIKDSIQYETDKNNVDTVMETHIMEDANIVSLNNLTGSVLKSDNYAIESVSFEYTEEPAKHIDDIIIEEQNDLTINSSEFNIFTDNVLVGLEDKQKPVNKDSLELITKSENELDEDFGDFDDFQVASTDSKHPTVMADCDNPWDVKESNDDDFGNFKANFENESSLYVDPYINADTIDHSKEIISCRETTDNLGDDDDDFGDFDDYKSSGVETSSNVKTEESVSVSQTPLLRLSSLDDDSQLTETINKVIIDIFEDEIPKPENEVEGKLESVLGETWGHLLETDVRQPYMVNWNNSVGQKTLLRALCIDSRNILFGPKWSYNMPKYAANLSAAPLQPLKQPSATTQSESVHPDKSSNKPPTTWTDPFTSDGQESCNVDTGSEIAAIETGPTDLDVFEASTSSKPDKIFSSTLNVQPLRHINLPDTHIFTPTDSETPRSKTIHYESSPAVLLPQTVIESDKTPPDVVATLSSGAVVTNMDDEYWEFQDFKGTSDAMQIDDNEAPVEKTESASPKTTTKTFATQVLQPIKVDPIIPTLNWPDPGEVKETFDDFSDFVSNSSWNDKRETPTTGAAQSDPPTNSNFIIESSKLSTTAISQPESNEAKSSTGDRFDDEFDTFQSALPPKTSLEFDLSNMSKDVSPNVDKVASPNIVPQIMTDFDNVFPNVNSFNSGNISFPSSNQTKDIPFIPSNIDNAPEVLDRNVPLQSSSVQINNTNILQPTHARMTIQSKQKSGQILQPLSLESFSQINWPSPGMDLQDLSRFNPVETLQSLKSDLSTNSHSKVASPVHNQKALTSQPDDDWGEFMSSKPKPQQPLPKKLPVFADDDEWTDFVSSPSVKPQNGLNTISLNVHTNLNNQKSNTNKFSMKTNQLDIPTLNYITPKSSNHKTYNDRHFQNL